MGDDWEDWENFTPAPAAVVEAPKPAGSGLAADVDMSKFKDEEKDALEDPKYVVPASQPKKKEEKKYEKGNVPLDVPLDDPLAEKLRRQRLEEQADFAAARELFGEVGEGLNIDLFLPKTVKEFEDFATAIVRRYVVAHRDSKNYKAFLKALVKSACVPMPSTEIKDIETSLAGLRAEKHKAEQAEAAAKKGKKQLNVGKTGGTAGLDDYIYDDDAGGDDYDFM